MSDTHAILALSRFGLGARPDELDDARHDPKGWLLAQLEPAPVPDAIAALPSSEDRVATHASEVLRNREPDRMGLRQTMLEEQRARMVARLTSRRPFHERLVAHWSNHFTVSALRPEVRAMAAVHERAAIRPHVLGRFGEMLRASTLHPAMLLYLDNVASIGPSSMAGRYSGRGLNENLAREVLELHTLGVDGGYGQHDVEALARMLTGWTLFDRQLAPSGRTLFFEERHEPGRVALLGRTFGGAGADDAVGALAHLADHPATARHVAHCLARHFCADDPPDGLVEALASRFAATGGDLRALAITLVERPEPWEAPLAKVRTPDDFVTAIGRALQLEDEPESLLQGLDVLGQVPFTAPSPAGWSDRGEDWVSPASVRSRIDIVQRAVFAYWQSAPDPEALAENLLGPVLSDQTRAAIGGANRAEALAILLACPEFQRR
jgi:uncharacterized protein (DUF1800 family)